MPSDKHSLIMAKASYGLDFLLFNVALVPTVRRYILYGLTSVLLCVPLIFAESEMCQFGDTHYGFLCVMEIVRIFHSDCFDYRGAFQKVLD